MNFDQLTSASGEQLSSEGFDQLVERAEAVCECERQRIELRNRPGVVAKKAEYKVLSERDEALRRRLYHAGPPHEYRARMRRIWFCSVAASILVIAGFVLSKITLEPFQMGLKGLVYCLGIAVCVPFLVDTVLDRLASEKLMRVLAVVSAAVAMASLMTLAIIRGELLAKQTSESAPSVIIDNQETDSDQAKASTFYDDTLPLLQFVMVLLAFSMEVGAGIAFHDAQRIAANLGENHEELQREVDGLRERLSLQAQEILALESEPQAFVARFWRDFHWTLLKRSIGNASRLILGLLLAFVLSAGARGAQQRMELVILLDLSQSVASTGPDSQSEFQKNVAAVSKVLGRVPAGTHVTVVGITDDSFSQPFVLLSASVAPDAGYFGEKLSAARQQLGTAWRARSRDLRATFGGTDLFGAFRIAGQIFERDGADKHDVLVVFSDMWQESRELTAEEIVAACDARSLQKAKAQKLVPNLTNVDVYLLGTASPGRTQSEWECLHDFWVAYLAETGARPREYSVLREPKLFSRHTPQPSRADALFCSKLSFLETD